MDNDQKPYELKETTEKAIEPVAIEKSIVPEELVGFVPTANMRKYFEAMVIAGANSTITDICKTAGLRNQTYYYWKTHVPEFNIWLSYEWEKTIRPLAKRALDSIGLKKAETDLEWYKYVCERFGIGPSGFGNQLNQVNINLGNSWEKNRKERGLE